LVKKLEESWTLLNRKRALQNLTFSNSRLHFNLF